jgi:hypothetical protein
MGNVGWGGKQNLRDVCGGIVADRQCIFQDIHKTNKMQSKTLINLLNSSKKKKEKDNL